MSSELPLGKIVSHPTKYDPNLLCSVARELGRSTLGLTAASKLPFHGMDYWHAYELSWLNQYGKPQRGVLHIAVPVESEYLIESKSLKLYLGALQMTQFNDQNAILSLLKRDLSDALGVAVQVSLQSLAAWRAEVMVATQQEITAVKLGAMYSLDELPIKVTQFQPDVSLLSTEPSSNTKRQQMVSETLITNLFRSLCPVTGQPDWATVLIRYHGLKINHQSILCYLVSYREHNAFHEHCVERIFMDLLQYCSATKLTVYSRFNRRGGIDINPYRSNYETIPSQPILL